MQPLDSSTTQHPAPTHNTAQSMASKSLFGSLTGYFVYVLLTATLGPLLFGFHLVWLHN